MKSLSPSPNDDKGKVSKPRRSIFRRRVSKNQRNPGNNATNAQEVADTSVAAGALLHQDSARSDPGSARRHRSSFVFKFLRGRRSDPALLISSLASENVLDRSSSRKNTNFRASAVKKLLQLDGESNYTLMQSSETATDKRILGIKHTLGHRRGDKKLLFVHLENGKVVFEVKARLSATIDQVRRTLEMAALETIPPRFLFLYFDDIPVAEENEENTFIESCISKDGMFRICRPPKVQHRSHNLHFDETQLREITSEAESVVRCCLRILEALAFDKRNSIDLPSCLDQCFDFIRDLARATMSSERKSKVKWKLIEVKLRELEQNLRIKLRREKFVAVMSYLSDLDQISENIQMIQQELLHSHDQLSDDHPVFFVRMEKPQRETETLLQTLRQTSFLDLCGEKHSRTRHQMSDFLDMDEMDVINKIKNKGVSTVFDTGMFRNAGELLAKQSSYRSMSDIDTIKDMLAPEFHSQEALVSKKAKNFNPRSCQWAISKFDDWTQDIESEQRCFLFVGPPASGKSTFISHIVRERSNIVLASHYLRHDDVRTTDPKVMLLSIVYQLCMQSVSFENKVRSLLVERRMTRQQLLSKTYSTAALFRDFLEGPLRSIDVRDNHCQCIVIEGIELGNEGNGDRNPILKTVRNFLCYLPPWLRLIISARPQVSILKRLRCLNAKLVEPKEVDFKADLKVFFLDTLTEIQYGSTSEREALSESLADTAEGNFVYGTILAAKARAAQEYNASSLLEDYVGLDFDHVLDKDLAIVTDGHADLFWQLVRLSLVAFRALSKTDVVALTGCTMKELEHLLDSGKTFFFVTDTTIIRFGQKLIKRWLLKKIGRFETGVRRNSIDKFSFASTKTHFAAEIKSCHRLFSHKLLALLERCRRVNHFNFEAVTTKSYIMQYGLQHLILGDMESEARVLLLDFAMLIEKSADYEGLLLDLNLFSQDDEFIQLVKRAVTLSVPALKEDSRQIASQLVGRLKAAAIKGHGNPAVQHEALSFVESLENHDFGFNWWCPVKPTWDQAEQALVKRLKAHEGQVQSVDLHIDDMHCATASWDGKVRVFDILTGVCEAEFNGHASTVWCVHWDYEGKSIVSGGADGTVRIFDFEMHEVGLVLKGHQDCVFSTKYSADSSFIASGSKDGSIRIWNADTGICKQFLEKSHDGFVYSVGWKPKCNNRYLCSGGTDNLVKIWDLETACCTLVCSGHMDWVRSVCWSPNGQNIYSGSSDQTVMCFNALSGECEQVLMGHSGGIWAVSRSADGRYVFSGSADGTVKIWEVSTWKCDQTLIGHDGPVLSVSVASDSCKVMSGGADNSLIEWDCVVERSTSVLDGHSKPIWSIDVTSNGQYVVSASSDCSARIWNVKSGLVERVLSGHTGPVWSAKFSHSGRYVATASSDNSTAIYRVSTGRRNLLLTHCEAVWDAVWSTDDKKVYTSSRDLIIRRWNATHGHCEAEYNGHTKDVKGLALSPDGLRLASASLDATIRVWDLITGDCQKVLHRKEAGVVSIEWVDNVVLTAGYTSGCVRLWNANTGDRMVGFLPGHSRRTNAVSVSPDGKRIVSASTDKDLRVWNIEDQECERRIEANTGLGVLCAKWSPDGTRIFSGGSDRAVRVWVADTARCESVMAGETGLGIFEVSWSPTSNLVASGSLDREVQIWNSETGDCIHTFKGHTNWVHAVDWSKDGTHVLSRSDDNTSRLWNLETGECEKVFDEALIPEEFEVGSAKTSTVDLSGLAEGRDAVGIQCDKVRVHGELCCGWVGKMVHFFRLISSQDLELSLSQFSSGGNSSFVVDAD